MNPTAPPDVIPWAGIAAGVPDALIYADDAGLVRVWNAGAAALFGFSAAEALGQSLDLIIPERLRAAHWAAYDRTLAAGATRGGTDVRTTRATHRDGRKLYVEMSFGVVLDGDGRALGSVAVARDGTARHLAAAGGPAAAA
ncbi:PAS domain S-box protein [Ottowia sp.]|jgi:PAS domain S-box-containing protein|uniref:PAS domain-containing protein n=1 Tax=Ottowia sp. TaxID=1898956 RepID=UPI0025DCF08B|nr:PAS domain S-box protein [Ottowia sp.]MBK6615303.1 PAS domain S-box protein [Ottowia sp.]